jgi:hypothetical protein
MKIVYDTSEFMDWSMAKYGMTNGNWHKLIWRPYMCDYFMNGHSSVGFSKFEKPDNIFEEQMNDFIDEIKDSIVWIEFT